MKPRARIKLSLSEMAANGYWLCSGCGRITEPTDNWAGSQACALCQSQNIRWNPPVLTEESNVPMSKQSFTVEFLSDSNTRWQCSPADLAGHLKSVSDLIAGCMTEGTRPAVKVVIHPANGAGCDIGAASSLSQRRD